MSVGVRHVAGATRIATLRQSGCMKCVFPRIFRADAEAVLVNTAGGVTGGDRLSLAAQVAPGAHLTFTTQAAERIYRTTDGSTGRIDNRIEVGDAGRLHWLPQETILFDRAALDRRLEIALAGDARLLMAETLVFGRAAMGETLRDVALEDRIRITRDGMPLYLDGVRLCGDVAAQMALPAMGGGAGCVSTVVFAAPEAEAHLPQLRALLPDTAGASLRGDGLVVVRALARDSLALRRFLIPVLELLSGQTLPSVWRL